jgi:hypothetical protein
MPAGARTSARVGHACLRGGGRARLRDGSAWSSLFFGSFAPHFQIKLGIHASNIDSRFVSMSELELSFLMGVLAPYFNTMDLVKILEKKQKLHIQIVAVTLTVTSCKTISKKKKSEKKVKNQDFMDKTNYFLRTLPFSPWAVSATWLHGGAP